MMLRTSHWRHTTVKAAAASLLGAALCLMPATLQAQQAAGPADTPPATAAAAELSVLDVGDCPDTPSGFEQGNAYACTCPSSPSSGAIYGSGTYSNDSNICVAAIHAGVLRKGANGPVVLEIVASPPMFRGKAQSGIKSEVWPKPTASAFQFAPPQSTTPK